MTGLYGHRVTYSSTTVYMFWWVGQLCTSVMYMRLRLSIMYTPPIQCTYSQIIPLHSPPFLPSYQDFYVSYRGAWDYTTTLLT